MKDLILELSLPKRDLKIQKISKSKKQILQIIKNEINDTVDHFKSEDGGWKIRIDVIRSQILRDILGFCIEAEIEQAFFNEGLVIEFTKDVSFVRTKEEYHPIYMDERTGELHVIENSDDKSYHKKFTESNGYFFIGKL